MIAYLKGKLVYKDPTHVVVEVNGVGYHVHISLHTFSEVKEREDIRLLTYYHVREDATFFLDSLRRQSGRCSST